MKSFAAISSLAAVANAFPWSERLSKRWATDATLLTDLSVISRSWGQISTYADNPENYFGVSDVGLPDGCAIEQAHSLQRHAQRFPTSSYDDGTNNEHFAAKVKNWTAANPDKKFTGLLEFLNTYEYQMGESYLTGLGATTEFMAGVQFWNRYGRNLFNATPGQVAYNASYPNGTARAKPVLRTTSQSRIWNSQINWALGFFGPSFQFTPEPSLANWTVPFDVVVIPEGGTENNTLASYDSCFDDDVSPVEDLGDINVIQYVALYMKDAVTRISSYVPEGFGLTVNDTYAMQSICAYENGFIGDSDFCGLFTANEWAGFEQSLDIEYYYDYAWGNPTGRAQGIGYLQELIARLTNQYITSSNSSVNSTLDDNAETFPLGEKFYVDLTHDDIIISTLTAMSLEYLKDAPDLTTYPPNPNRTFILSHLTPFGGRLVTEVIGCNCDDPTVNPNHTVPYYVGENGYEASTATNKFIRMRVNHGILPLSSIPGGYCTRPDGLCPLESFLKSQENATAAANYQFACFGNYTIDDPTNPPDYDGTIFES